LNQTAKLIDVVKREVAEYAWDQADSKAYFLLDAARHVYSVLVVPTYKPQKSLPIIVARVTDHDQVAIETDLTDKPLFDALLKAGVPRSQIIRAYRGET
jgi:hypothetical protein